MPGKWLLFAVAVILIGAGAGAVSVLFRGQQPVQPEVVEAPANQRAVVEEISLEGTVVAQNVVGVPAPVEGTLEAVLVSIGEEVYEGQLLAQIRNTAIEDELRIAEEDTAEAESEVNQLESRFISARLEASRANAEMSRSRSIFQRAEQAWLRSQTLIRAGAIPRREHERAEADYQAKRQDYESLQKVADASNGQIETLSNQMEKARQEAQEAREEFDLITSELMAADVIAIANGILAGMSAQQGEEVHPEAGDLFQIAVDLSRLDVVAEPGQAVADRILPGQPARVYLAEFPSGWASGEVREVQEGRVVVEFISPAAAVLPGLTAQVTISPVGSSAGR